MRKINIKLVLFRSKWTIASVLFLALIGFGGDGCLLERYYHWKEISRLTEELEFYKKKFDNDKKTLEKLKRNPEEIVKVARERYYMKTPDEDIFIIEDDNE